MSAKKLSDSATEEIIEIYRTTTETTATLAERYDVSSSTIGRLLKNNLSPQEYQQLVVQKRIYHRSNRSELPLFATDALDEVATFEPTTPEPELVVSFVSPPPELDITPLEDILDEQEEDNDPEDELDFEGDEEEELEDEDELGDELSPLSMRAIVNADVMVKPLSEATLPKICYLVIDRSAELITRPLKDFTDLGKISSAEVQHKTLPIFDNQRVAKRFSHRSHRVIKVPDTQILRKTSSYLEAKGITRLLIDGQLYSI